jgi:hypothetical protein
MSSTSEQQVAQQFRERVDEGLTDAVSVSFRIVGGAPEERIEEEVRVLGSGQANAAGQDRLSPRPLSQASAELPPAEITELFRQIGQDVERLVPRSEARFVPDSVVRSVTLRVGEAEATWYYLADDDAERLEPDQRAASEMPGAVAHLNALAQRLLAEGGV